MENQSRSDVVGFSLRAAVHEYDNSRHNSGTLEHGPILRAVKPGELYLNRNQTPQGRRDAALAEFMYNTSPIGIGQVIVEPLVVGIFELIYNSIIKFNSQMNEIKESEEGTRTNNVSAQKQNNYSEGDQRRDAPDFRGGEQDGYRAGDRFIM